MKFLNDHEAAVALGVSVFTIRRRIESGRLAAINMGSNKKKLWRIRPEDLAAAKSPEPEFKQPRRRHRPPAPRAWPEVRAA